LKQKNIENHQKYYKNEIYFIIIIGLAHSSKSFETKSLEDSESFENNNDVKIFF